MSTATEKEEGVRGWSWSPHAVVLFPVQSEKFICFCRLDSLYIGCVYIIFWAKIMAALWSSCACEKIHRKKAYLWDWSPYVQLFYVLSYARYSFYTHYIVILYQRLDYIWMWYYVGKAFEQNCATFWHISPWLVSAMLTLACWIVMVQLILETILICCGSHLLGGFHVLKYVKWGSLPVCVSVILIGAIQWHKDCSEYCDASWYI